MCKNDGLLIVATHGNGIYQTNINSLSDILSSPSIENSLNFKIYPNPVINRIQIELPNSLDVNSIFTIYDEIGKIIINRELNDLSNSKNNFSLDISNLRAGIYFASLRSKDMITTKQFIKK